MRQRLKATLTTLLLTLSASTYAAPPSYPPATAAAAEPSPEQRIAQQLADPDAAVRAAALQAIRELAAKDPNSVAAPLRRQWLVALARAGFHDDIIQITQAVILTNPASQLVTESMLRPRIYALLALHRNDEALADARRFFNVCRLDSTGVAVDLLVGALQAARGDQAKAKLRQFRMRQMTAARATTQPVVGASTTEPSFNVRDSDQSSDTAVTDALLLSIPLDVGPYLDETAKWKGNRSRVVYGNLLLMAGKTDEAFLYFTDCLNQARTDHDLAVALERQSAAIRAQDGNLARAQGRLREMAAPGL